MPKETGMMEKLVLTLPTLYADHHVLTLRQALLDIEGVTQVYASSAWKRAIITFDAEKTSADDLEKAAAQAGYPVGEAELPVLVEREIIGRDPQWEKFDLRVSKTNQADLEMSGEHRRY
jgi:copper chaperone CopZ